MRAFVAIDLPGLEGPIPPGLRPEDHLTLQFFEDLPADQLPAVVEILSAVAASASPFELEVRGVGAFPSVQRPRVVWAAIGEGGSALQSLTERLRQTLIGRGFPAERRPFVPHVTLNRVRSPRDVVWAHEFLRAPENEGRIWARFRVSELVLKESELLPSGARHTVRARAPLGTAAPDSSGQRGSSGEGERSRPPPEDSRSPPGARRTD
jgi:RNA 2',3'-cyclic 3'-phosphodiesterase